MVFENPSSFETITTNIRITIFPVKENGIIFYSEKKAGDFIGLALKKSHLEFR